MAATATTSGRSILTSFSFSNNSETRRSFSRVITKTTIRPGSFVFSTTNLGGISHILLQVRASAGPNPTEPSNLTTNISDSSASEGDLNYALKLIIGSILGAALIKYGSILLPDITRPNIVQALLMISTPVVVAVSLLVKESSKE